VVNCSYIERLNATFHARLASLTRRTLTLQHGMYLIGTINNFCTPHASLSYAGSKTTPAMIAGITDDGWNVCELLSYCVPPPPWTSPTRRGLPTSALKCLIEQCCRDHGWL
jgi:hypothetical protein